MKISVLTTTYNRAEDLEKLYTSLIVNNNSNVKFEWLIMDDGSTDKTKLVLDNFMKQKIIDMHYFYQENAGKMSAMNNLVKYATGDVIVVCDSDDYFVTGAFDIINKYSKKLLEDDTVYALAFLKKNEAGKISGEKFPEKFYRSDMFSLYFKENMTGEKILVFNAEIRKKYQHQLEADEKFVTEARMYHKMDLDYDLICINEVLEIGDYKDDGYTNNLNKVFKENPLGYYMYFKEILAKNLSGVSFSKRWYIYKHYILFANLAQQAGPISNVKGILNKLMIILLWIPGSIKTRRKFKVDKVNMFGKSGITDNKKDDHESDDEDEKNDKKKDGKKHKKTHKDEEEKS